MQSKESQAEAEARFPHIRYGAHLPRLSRFMARLLAPVNRAFDRVYQSEFNPLYRSGTLAVALLVILVVTGVYLLIFYSISAPYESVRRISEQPLGRIVRSVHRSSANLAVLAIIFHVLQLVAQGKTWGPRILAWVSGVIVSGLFCLAAWSGMVLVWDVHGQLVASSGAELFAVMPFLTDVLQQAFDGSTPIGASFFFVNLFLHAALPLGLIGGLWVHTSKLARAKWYPIKPLFVSLVLALVLLAVLVQAPLQPKADLLQVIGGVQLNGWYAGWIPLLDSFGPGLTLLFFGAAFLILISVPWWIRPAHQTFSEPSVVDADRCTGCTQCASDCPWEAISMQPRADGKRLLAVVSPDACVSCGICAASCGETCIGPPARNAEQQLMTVESYLQQQPGGSTCIVACCNNGSMLSRLRTLEKEDSSLSLFPVECCGTVHSRVIEQLLGRFERIAFAGCPERNCVNRDGLLLLSERVYERRVPFLDRSIDRRRILLSAFSDGETEDLKGALREFDAGKNSHAAYVRAKARTLMSIAQKTIVTSLILALVSFGDRIPYGESVTHGVVRLSLRLPASVQQGCRPPTDEERKTVPRHMQAPAVCTDEPVHYAVRVEINGRAALEKTLGSASGRTDRPLFFSEDLQVAPGEQEVNVVVLQQPEFQPAMQFSQRMTIEEGSIYLLRSVNDVRGLFMLRE